MTESPPRYRTASARQVGGDHYQTMAVQPWDAMHAWLSPEQFRGFLRGNAIKYLARADNKEILNMPERIQLKRTKGWRMPETTVKVDRSTKWGNPFRVTEDRTAAESVSAFRIWLTVDGCDADIPERKQRIIDSLHEIRGKDLACWCKPGTPCHADVLLELANGV